MATISAQYTVSISGWQGKVVMADGSEATTRLFCMGDKNILTDALKAMQNEGQIQSYEVVWTEVQNRV